MKIEMNSEMKRLLNEVGLASLSRAIEEACPDHLPKLVTINGSVLFANQYENAQHTSIKECCDRTGFEAFLNHYHVRWDGTAAGIRGLIQELAGIRRSLLDYAPGKSFLILLAIREGEYTIRFHELHPGESWLAPDLEGYKEEAVAVIGVGPGAQI